MAIVLVLQLHYQLACVTVPTIAGKVMAARDAVLTVVHIGCHRQGGHYNCTTSHTEWSC
jgi:hypothetical protein